MDERNTGSLPEAVRTWRPDRKKGKEKPEPPLTVIYAGESRRRRQFILHAFPDATNFNFPSGVEPDIPDVVAIAKGKIRFVNAMMPDMSVDRATNRRVMIVAADTRTGTLAVNRDGSNTELKSRGKPRNPQEVIRTFQAMHEASERFDTPPFYQAISGSFSELKDPRRYEKTGKLVATTVELDPDFVERISSNSRFQDYQITWDDFYSKPPYSNVGHTSVHMADISGGISLPVLARMGAVVAIEGITVTDPDFPQVLKRGIYNAAVGFAPAVLKPILPNIEELIDGWPWLNQVAEAAMRRG